MRNMIVEAPTVEIVSSSRNSINDLISFWSQGATCPMWLLELYSLTTKAQTLPHGAPAPFNPNSLNYAVKPWRQ